jgi:hypothetical protein
MGLGTSPSVQVVKANKQLQQEKMGLLRDIAVLERGRADADQALSDLRSQLKEQEDVRRVVVWAGGACEGDGELPWGLSAGFGCGGDGCCIAGYGDALVLVLVVQSVVLVLGSAGADAGDSCPVAVFVVADGCVRARGLHRLLGQQARWAPNAQLEVGSLSVRHGNGDALLVLFACCADRAAGPGPAGGVREDGGGDP